MAALLSFLPTQVLTNDGKPAAGYKLRFFAGGSFSVPQPAYTTGTGDVALPNPVVVDNAGRVPSIWLDLGQTYNITLSTPDETTVIQTWVNMQGALGFSGVQDIINAGSFLPLSGGTLTGPLVTSTATMGSTTISTLVVSNTSSLGTATALLVTSPLNAAGVRLQGVGAPTAPTDAATKGYVDAFGLIPAGAVFYTASATAPTGYLIADGSSVSRTTYASLFAAIGATYGSADASSFNLPDLRGVFIRGLDRGRGEDPTRALGSYQEDDLASHAHAGVPTLTSATQAGTTTSTFSITAVGVSAATGGVETRPVNVALNPIIKV